MLTNIERERKRRGIKKQDMSLKLGVSRTTYDHWVKGKTDIPSRKLYDIAKFFGVSMEYLIEQRKEQ